MIDGLKLNYSREYFTACEYRNKKHIYDEKKNTLWRKQSNYAQEKGEWF